MQRVGGEREMAAGGVRGGRISIPGFSNISAANKTLRCVIISLQSNRTRTGQLIVL